MNFLALKNDIQIGVAHAESLWFKSDMCTQTVSVASQEGGICWPMYPKLRLLSAGRQDRELCSRAGVGLLQISRSESLCV